MIIYQAIDGYLLVICAAALILIAATGIGHGRGTFATTATRRLQWRRR